MYQQLKKVVPLIVNHRVGGTSIEQHLFRDLLLRARNGESTLSDWHTLLSRTPDHVSNIQDFEMSLIRNSIRFGLSTKPDSPDATNLRSRIV